MSQHTKKVVSPSDHSSFPPLTHIYSVVDVLQAQQYLRELNDNLDNDLDEHVFDFDEIRHAIDYNDMMDELGQSYREPSAAIDDLPSGYFDEDDTEEEDNKILDSDFHVSRGYAESSNAESQLGSGSLEDEDQSDDSDHSEPVLHKRLTGMFLLSYIGLNNADSWSLSQVNSLVHSRCRWVFSVSNMVYHALNTSLCETFCVWYPTAPSMSCQRHFRHSNVEPKDICLSSQCANSPSN